MDDTMQQSRYLGHVDGQLYFLKIEGHKLIDLLVEMGFTRNQVYGLLAKRLGVRTQQAHFSHMKSVNECKSAVAELQKMVQSRRNKLDRRTIYRKVFSDKEVLREVGRRNTEKLGLAKKPWWKRLLECFV